MNVMNNIIVNEAIYPRFYVSNFFFFSVVKDLSVILCEKLMCEEVINQVYPDVWYRLCLVASRTKLFVYQHGVLLLSV